MTKNKLSPITINDSFKNLSNVQLTFYLRRDDFKPSIQWAKDKITYALKSIGNRYITYNKSEYENLNIEVDLHDIFESVSNPDEFKFDYFLETLIVASNFEDAWEYIHLGHGIEYYYNLYKDNDEYIQKDELKETIFELIYQKKISVDQEKKIAITYSNLSKLIHLLLSFYVKYEDLLKQFQNLHSFKKNFFSKRTLEIIQSLDSLYHKILNHPDAKLVEQYLDMNSPYEVEKIRKILKRTISINARILNEFKKIIFEDIYRELHHLNPNNHLTTYLFKYSLVFGEAMSGKTHVLSDIANIRINSNKPTILIYAQKFDNTLDTPIQHCIKQLGLEHYQFTDENFLELLNNWGEESNELVFFIVDAINETTNKNIWKDNLIEFVTKVKQYPFIALVMSIRDVEKKTLLTRSIQEYISLEMTEIIHKGFEKIEYKVLKKFCRVFEIKLPNFPMLSPIFANPGLLFLFFETLKKNNIQQIDEKVLKPNHIIKEYIKDRNNHFKELYNVTDRRMFIIQATNIVSQHMLSNNLIEEISYDEIFPVLNNLHPLILDYLISEGILLERINNYDEVYLYYSYQKFGNYFLALYLLPDNFSKDNILNKDILKSLFVNYYDYQAIVEALIIRLSEDHRLDFIDIFPKLFEENNNLWQIRYKCFAKSLKLPKTFEQKLNNFLDSDEKDDILELLLGSAFEKSSQFNIKKNLHPLLLFQSMNQRDYHWSLYIHESFSNEGIVKKIIDWAWNKKEEFGIEDESLYLYGLTLGWFLTSSNRELRDGATKALVNLFTDRVDIFLRVLKEFETVNDLYVLERLYSIGYGIVLRSGIENGFKELGEYIYQTIFCKHEVVEHILLRDNARFTVEYINTNIVLDIEISKVLPPYSSNMPSNYPTLKEIEGYGQSEKYSGFGWSHIVSSMRTEKIGNYGDFGRYTFQSALMNFKDIDYQELSNYACKVIFEEYIINLELFEETEIDMTYISHQRHEHKVERIGKKYQWLAMFKVLAMVADNYQVKEHSSGCSDEKYNDYNTASILGIRDIDPTSILREKIKTNSLWWFNVNDDFENTELSDDKDWLESKDKLPSIKEVICSKREGNNYLALDVYFSKSGDKRKDQYRSLSYSVYAYIVKKEDFSEILDWLKKQNFYGNDISEYNSIWSVYLREYPNSQSYKEIDKYYYGQNTWDDAHGSSSGILPHNILLSSTEYLNENSGYDSSLSNTLDIKLPNKWLLNEMGLRQSLNDGEWVNEKGEVVFFDPSVSSCCINENSNSGVLMADKKILLDFLDKNGYTLFWTLNAEKMMKDTDYMNKSNNQFLGYGKISGYGYFEDDKFIENIVINLDGGA